MLVSLTNQILSILAIIGIALTAVLLAAVFSARIRRIQIINHFISNYSLIAAWGVVAAGAAASLWYSNVLGYAPCSLCWWQRIFLYPQAIILGMGLWKKDQFIADYCLALGVPGLLVAGYHTYLQWGGSPFISCGADVISCSQRFVSEFGYITLPFMSFIAFALSIALLLSYKKNINQSYKII